MSRLTMDFLINELSLTGQYDDIDEFTINGAAPMCDMLSLLKDSGYGVYYKKTDFNLRQVTDEIPFYEIITGSYSRTNDRLRLLKVNLSKLLNDPYWDMSPQQSVDFSYLSPIEAEKEVSGSSVAEAFEREGCLLSFAKSGYTAGDIRVERHHRSDPKVPSVSKDIANATDRKMLVMRLMKHGLLSREDGMRRLFTKKLNFDEVSARNGLNLITDGNLSLFLSTFEGFESKTWEQILVDDGLDFKEFHKNRNTKDFFLPEYWRKTIRKFRVNDEIRVFGYIENGVFKVLRIDLDHVLSDLG